MTDRSNPADSIDEQHQESPPQHIFDSLRAAMTPLATTNPAAKAVDLTPVGERLANAEIVGLGESTHGTSEFFELKHRIIQHLVIEHDVRTVAIESNLPETMELQDYVLHGAGSPRAALAEVPPGPWHVESFLAMVEWLREFNADRQRGDCVDIYGFGAHSTKGAVERLREHFAAVEPGVLERISDDLDTVDDGGKPPIAVSDVPARIAATERLAPMLRDHFDDQRRTHVSATSERALARARRYVSVLEQVIEMVRALDDIDGDEFVPTDERLAIPGLAMAENVGWIYNRTENRPLVLWAHDAHLNREAYTGPDTDAAGPSLGTHLDARHGDDYFAVGFSFGRGGFQALTAEADDPNPREHVLDGPLPGTFDATLDTLDEPLAFVDMRAACTDERTADWLSEPRRQFRTGGTYDPDTPEDHLAEYVYADAFDGLCFVAETSPACPLDLP